MLKLSLNFVLEEEQELRCDQSTEVISSFDNNRRVSDMALPQGFNEYPAVSDSHMHI